MSSIHGDKMEAVILLKFSCHSHSEITALFRSELKIIQDIFPNRILTGKVSIDPHNLHGLYFKIKVRHFKATFFNFADQGLPFNFIPFSFRGVGILRGKKDRDDRRKS